MQQNKQKLIFGFVLCAATVFSVWAFFYGTLMPHLQMQTYIKYAFYQNPRTLLDDDHFIFANYPYSEVRILQDNLSFITGIDVSYPNFSELSDQAIDKMTEFLSLHPHYPLFYGMLGRAYDNKAIQMGDISFFDKANESYKQAIELSPKGEEFYFM